MSPVTTKEAVPDEAGPGLQRVDHVFPDANDVLFSLVLLMLPFGGGRRPAGRPAAGLMTAREAVGDIAGICERKPDVCETGKSALHTIGVRAKASARIAYDMLGEPDETIKTGTVVDAAAAKNLTVKDAIAMAEKIAPAQ